MGPERPEHVEDEIAYRHNTGWTNREENVIPGCVTDRYASGTEFVAGNNAWGQPSFRPRSRQASARQLVIYWRICFSMVNSGVPNSSCGRSWNPAVTQTLS